MKLCIQQYRKQKLRYILFRQSRKSSLFSVYRRTKSGMLTFLTQSGCDCQAEMEPLNWSIWREATAACGMQMLLSASFWRTSSVCCQYVASVSGVCRQYVSCFWPKKARITCLLTSTYNGSCGLLSRRSWVRAPTLSFYMFLFNK